MSGFRKLISKDSLLRLYKAFLCHTLIIVRLFGTFVVRAIMSKLIP